MDKNVEETKETSNSKMINLEEYTNALNKQPQSSFIDDVTNPSDFIITPVYNEKLMELDPPSDK